MQTGSAGRAELMQNELTDEVTVIQEHERRTCRTLETKKKWSRD